MNAPRTILILGGGVASLTAAFELTSAPGWQQRYAVRVLQTGWRLGGKCASHRGESGRVEEHGLHVLFGAYHNLFGMLRRCYDELGRDPQAPLGTFEQAFLPGERFVMQEQGPDGLLAWDLRLPSNSGRPGVEGGLVDPRLVLQLLRGWVRESRRVLADARREGRPLRVEARRAVTMGELGAAVLRGLVVDRVPLRGFDVLDGEDLRQWLARHGASQRALQSAPLRAFYDLVFHEPDLTRPASGMGAGTGLRLLLRWLFSYKGAVAYWMAAGTGETMIAPLYQVLRARGVRFDFFTRVGALGLSEDGRRIDRVTVHRQATVRSQPYEPLVDVGGLPCWRGAPDWEQLVEGEELRARGANLESSWDPWAGEAHELRLGEDFDELVLGISLAALPPLVGELIERKPAWRSLVEHIATTATLGLQIWSEEARDGQQAMANSGVSPLTGASDMSHLLCHEQWGEGGPRHVLHVCHRMEAEPGDPVRGDPGPVRAWRAHGWQVAQRWLEGLGGVQVPGARGPGHSDPLDWGVLHDPQGRGGAERLEAQFLTSNIEPTERCVLALPGTLQHRLRPGGSGVDNLALCGTWTRNGLNIGGVEAAVMSGMQASRALCGSPAHVIGETDWR